VSVRSRQYIKGAVKVAYEPLYIHFPKLMQAIALWDETNRNWPNTRKAEQYYCVPLIKN
jgi:hypothetical protein